MIMFRFPRYRSSPATNGVVPSRPLARGSSEREGALQRELDALLAERAALVRQERAAAQNLARMQDSLDVLAGEIDRRAKQTRDPDLGDRGHRMVATVKEFWARQDDCGKSMPATVVSVIKNVLGLEPWPQQFASLRAPSPASAPIDPIRTAADIVTAGKKARAEIQPATPSDPTAAGIVRAGRRARNEPDNELRRRPHSRA
jgi:hypothetical protein